MSSTRQEVYKAIDGERDYQDRKWGTLEQHPHHVAEWVGIVGYYCAKAMGAHLSNDEKLHELRKVAAVAVAALEQHGVLGRPTVQRETDNQLRR